MIALLFVPFILLCRQMTLNETLKVLFFGFDLGIGFQLLIGIHLHWH